MLRYDIFYHLDFYLVFDYYPTVLDICMGKKWTPESKFVPDSRVRFIPPKSPNYIWSDPAPWVKKRPCSYSHDGEWRTPEYITGGSVTLLGKDELGSFLPAVGEYAVITESFRKKLAETPFQGYTCIPLELECNATDLSALDSENVYILLFLGNVADLDRLRRIARDPEMCCPHCHWRPVVCPECLGIAFTCPQCHSEIELLDYPPHLNVSSSYDHALKIEESFFQPVNGIGNGKLKCEVIQAQYWDGNDFISSNFFNCRYITGRVARWLVENQYGPAFLLPAPTDVSGCTEEQLEKIEQIKYST